MVEKFLSQKFCDRLKNCPEKFVTDLLVTDCFLRVYFLSAIVASTTKSPQNWKNAVLNIRLVLANSVRASCISCSKKKNVLNIFVTDYFCKTISVNVHIGADCCGACFFFLFVSGRLHSGRWVS